MKKLSDRYKKILIHRSRKSIRSAQNANANTKNRSDKAAANTPASNAFRPFIAQAWDGNIEQNVLCVREPIAPPKNINFDEGVEETLEFLALIKERIGRKVVSGANRPTWIKYKKGRVPRVYGFHDYSQISSISISAALVIAACYDRAARISGLAPPAINYSQWPQEVFRVLYDVGFFEFIGHIKAPNANLALHRGQDGTHKIISAISGKNANALEACSDEIFNLLTFMSYNETKATAILADVNSAVSEAMINVARHAYPKDFVEQSPYDTVGQWWMTAQADREKQTLKIVLYDQGATIPGTLPHRSWFKEAVETAIQQIIPNFKHSNEFRSLDHEYINYSMKEGKTQTGDKQRGLGLPQMQSLIDICDDGSLTIVSRGGLYRYDKNLGSHKQALPVDLEGTLIEWHLSLPGGAS